MWLVVIISLLKKIFISRGIFLLIKLAVYYYFTKAFAIYFGIYKSFFCHSYFIHPLNKYIDFYFS